MLNCKAHALALIVTVNCCIFTRMTWSHHLHLNRSVTLRQLFYKTSFLLYSCQGLQCDLTPSLCSPAGVRVRDTGGETAQDLE